MKEQLFFTGVISHNRSTLTPALEKVSEPAEGRMGHDDRPAKEPPAAWHKRGRGQETHGYEGAKTEPTPNNLCSQQPAPGAWQTDEFEMPGVPLTNPQKGTLHFATQLCQCLKIICI